MIKVIVQKSFEDAVAYTADKIASIIRAIPSAKLGLATGGTCSPIYAKLVDMFDKGSLDFSKLHTVNLDEYLGMSPENDLSYRKSMNTWLFDHVNIDKNNTYVASGLNDVTAETALFTKKIYENRPIDFQLLGVGVSGHVGFNEPSEKLTAGVHVETLTQSTIEANARFFDDISQVPTTAITMGMGDIFSAKEILLIASGPAKANAIKALITNDQIDTHVPCTMLKLHQNVTVVIDEKLAALIN